MKKSNWFAWLKWFFGFGQKPERKIVDEKTGVIDLTYPVEGYKVEHKKHYEARDVLIKKIEESKAKTIKAQSDVFNNRLADLKISVDNHYRKEKVEFTIPEVKRERVIIEPSDSFVESMVIGYATDSTVEGTLLGGDILGAVIGDMLNSSDDSPSSDITNYERGFDDGFGDGGFSGGGAGADYSSNSDYSSGSDYTSSTSSFDDSDTRQDW